MAGEDDRRSGDHEGSEDAGSLRSRLEGLVPDSLKRRISTVAQSQLGEDALRTIAREVVGEFKLPKEAVGYLMTQVDTTRREVIRVAASEFRDFLESANISEEIARILTTLSFEIRTEIRFVPNDTSLRPNVRSRVRMKSGSTEEDLGEVENDLGEVEKGLESALRTGLGDVAGRLLRRSLGGTPPPRRKRSAAKEEAEAAPKKRPRKPAAPRARKPAEKAEGPVSAPSSKPRRRSTGGSTKG